MFGCPAGNSSLEELMFRASASFLDSQLEGRVSLTTPFAKRTQNSFVKFCKCLVFNDNFLFLHDFTILTCFLHLFEFCINRTLGFDENHIISIVVLKEFISSCRCILYFTSKQNEKSSNNNAHVLCKKKYFQLKIWECPRISFPSDHLLCLPATNLFYFKYLGRLPSQHWQRLPSQSLFFFSNCFQSAEAYSGLEAFEVKRGVPSPNFSASVLS